MRIEPDTRRANFWLFVGLVAFAIVLCAVVLLWMRARTHEQGGKVYPPVGAVLFRPLSAVLRHPGRGGRTLAGGNTPGGREENGCTPAGVWEASSAEWDVSGMAMPPAPLPGCIFLPDEYRGCYPRLIFRTPAGVLTESGLAVWVLPDTPFLADKGFGLSAISRTSKFAG